MLYKEKDIVEDSVFRKKFSTLVSGIKLFKIPQKDPTNSNIISSDEKINTSLQNNLENQVDSKEKADQKGSQI